MSGYCNHSHHHHHRRHNHFFNDKVLVSNHNLIEMVAAG